MIAIFTNKPIYERIKKFPKNEELFLALAIILASFLITPLKHSLFPETRPFGVVNYTLFLVGITLLFYGYSNLKKIYPPMVLLAVLVVINTGFYTNRSFQDFTTATLGPPIAWFVASTLALFGYPTYSAHHVILFHGGSEPIVIAGNCTGIVSVLFIATIGAALLIGVHTTLKRKIACIVFGMAGAFITNLIRVFILILVYLYYDYPGNAITMMALHTHLGDSLFIVFVGIYWWLSFKYILIERPSQPPPEQKLIKESDKKKCT
jgi:archaeosortase C (PEF-CTERM variant)